MRQTMYKTTNLSPFIISTDLTGFSALPGFKAASNSDGQSALNLGITVLGVFK